MSYDERAIVIQRIHSFQKQIYTRRVTRCHSVFSMLFSRRLFLKLFRLELSANFWTLPAASQGDMTDRNSLGSDPRMLYTAAEVFTSAARLDARVTCAMNIYQYHDGYRDDWRTATIKRTELLSNIVVDDNRADPGSAYVNEFYSTKISSRIKDIHKPMTQSTAVIHPA